MKVLLLTDGSPCSLEAARWLAGHVSEFRDPGLHLLHVHPSLPYPRASEVVGRGTIERYQRETSGEALEPAARTLLEAGLAFDKSWTVGDIAPSIGDFTRAGGFDLVVMGSHGHGAALNLALGSVATKCIALLGVPIVVVPRAR